MVEEIDALLSARYPRVMVEAEVRQLSVSPAGHAFLSLTDGRSSLSAVCWRTTWKGLSYVPKQGERVLVRGRLSIYGARGQFQLYLNDIRPAGLGELARQIEARKLRLAAEGLLDERRKRALPKAPAVVGVATSLRGAALQDFLRVSGERCPAARIVVAGCTVQGAHAPAEIIQAIELLIRQGESEVIVVTRGGGSAQDLLAFQDEQLARFIADSPIPIVSAVGHEVDTTLADLVADVAVPTPTAAAVAVLPDAMALKRRLEGLELSLETQVNEGLERRRDKVMQLRQRLRGPAQRIHHVRAMALQAEKRMAASWNRSLAERRQATETLKQRLEALSPRGVLQRGYAMVRQDGVPVMRRSAVDETAPLQVEFWDGMLDVSAESKGP